MKHKITRIGTAEIIGPLVLLRDWTFDGSEEEPGLLHLSSWTATIDSSDSIGEYSMLELIEIAKDGPTPPEPTTCTCSDFKAAESANEVMRSSWYGKGDHEWRIGNFKTPLQFCPWCGFKLP